MSFNPILEVRALPRIRFSIRDLRPTLSTALVLYADGASPIIVRAGEVVPQARFGPYRELYVVDMAEHSLELACDLPSNDGALSFRARVHYACQVDAPAIVVRNSVHNVAEALRPLIIRELRAYSSSFQPHEIGHAERVLDTKLGEYSPTGLGIAIRRCTVELSLDPDVERAIRTKHNVTKEIETEGLWHEHLLPLVESGDTGLIAMYLAKNKGQAGAVFELLLAHDRERGEQMIEAIKTAMHGRSPDDDFQIEEARTRMLDQAVDGLNPGSRTGRVPRESRLRGSLLRSATPELDLGDTTARRPEDTIEGRAVPRDEAPPDPDED
jgi:hypothetical protein